MKASKKTNTLSMCAAVKRDGYNLPSHDALTQILPNYHRPVKGAKTKPHHAPRQEHKRAAEKQPSNKPIITHTHQIHSPHTQPPHGFEDELQLAQITEPRTKEVERYHSALSKMAEDIIALRTQVVTLEAEKSRLRIDLSLHQDLGRHLLDNTDIDIMTKAELADSIASLKFKLSGEASEAASQRNRIQQLQNELIKKNDIEKELLRLQRVVQQQAVDQKHHQSCLARMATLEATVKRQEKIIEKMEKTLDSKLSVRNEQSGDKGLVEETQKGEIDHRKQETESVLAAEITRLRQESDWICQQPRRVTMRQSAQTEDTLSFRESLLNKLEQAEARVQALEAQLEENSKSWGRQKQDLLTTLNEYRHGFVRTSASILYNEPLKPVCVQKRTTGGGRSKQDDLQTSC